MSAATSSPHDRAAQDRVIAQQRAHEPSMEEILASIRRIIADDQRPAARQEPTPAATLAPGRPANLDDAPQVSAPRPAAPLVEPPISATRHAEPARGLAPPIAAQPRRFETFGQAAQEALAAQETLAARDVVSGPDGQGAPAAHAVSASHGLAAAAPSAGPQGQDETFEFVTETGEIGLFAAEEDDDIVELTTPATPNDAMDAPGPAHTVEPLRLVSPETDAAVGAQFQQLQATLLADNARRVDELTREMLRPMLKAWLDDNLPVLVEKLVRAEIERVARGGR